MRIPLFEPPATVAGNHHEATWVGAKFDQKSKPDCRTKRPDLTNRGSSIVRPPFEVDFTNSDVK